MTVAELIKLLKKHPKDMKVAFEMFSEHCLLDEERIETKELCHPRNDGWVQDKRPDMETETYLVFPGN